MATGQRVFASVCACAFALTLTACATDDDFETPGASIAPTEVPSDPSTPEPSDVPGDATAFTVRGLLTAHDGSAEVAFSFTLSAPIEGLTDRDLARFNVQSGCAPEIFEEKLKEFQNPGMTSFVVESHLVSGELGPLDLPVVIGTPNPSAWEGDWASGGAPCGMVSFENLPGRIAGSGVVEYREDLGEPGGYNGWIRDYNGYGLSITRTVDGSPEVFYEPTECEVEFGAAAPESLRSRLVQIDRDNGCSFGLVDR